MAIIFHLDLDAFFVSVERILRPELAGKPVIVGADPKGRGVVSACSYEARKFGIHSAMPIKTAYKLCPDGIYLRGDYKNYEKYSKTVRAYLEKFAPEIEQASIDEFYMDFTGCEKIYGDYLNFAGALQSGIYKEFSLPCSIGIAGNKTAAKIAANLNKPGGLVFIVPGEEKKFLENLPVQAIPGVGKKTLKELNYKGFFKIGDIAKAAPEYLFDILGKSGVELWRRANGEGSSKLNEEAINKSVSKEISYQSDEFSEEKIIKSIFELTAKACHNLRLKKLLASTISIKLRYENFSTLTRGKTTEPTDDEAAIFKITRDLFYQTYQKERGVRLIGVHLSKLVEPSAQDGLFDGENKKRKKYIDAVNELRNKYGYEKIKIGSI